MTPHLYKGTYERTRGDVQQPATSETVAKGRDAPAWNEFEVFVHWMANSAHPQGAALVEQRKLFTAGCRQLRSCDPCTDCVPAPGEPCQLRWANKGAGCLVRVEVRLAHLNCPFSSLHVVHDNLACCRGLPHGCGTDDFSVAVDQGVVTAQGWSRCELLVQAGMMAVRRSSDLLIQSRLGQA